MRASLVIINKIAKIPLLEGVTVLVAL